MAEGTIKNRIVIEGEAEYKKALAEINRALKESKSELKAVAAEYAASGSSAKGLTAQIDALEKTHAQQSEQLTLMQEHLTKVTAAYGENSREAVELRTKINNARAEMAKTSGELTQLRTRLDAAGDAMDDLSAGAGGAEKGLERIGDEADDAQAKVGDLGDELGGLDDLVPDLKGKLAGALTIGAVGKGVEWAFSLANDELVAWQNLAAYTGETGDNLERLKGVSRTVYQAGYGESLMEVTTSVSQIYQQTGLMDDDLEHCVETALSLSRVFGMDVGESTRAVSALMQNFGIDAETAYDYIVTGAQNGADKNGNLLDTINEYSPYFAQSGKGADEFFAALIEGAQAGVYDVDKIGDAWKEFMLRVTSGEDGPKDALKELGFAATDVTKKIAAGGPAADLATQQIVQALASVEDPFERNRLGVALFGTQWEDTGGRCLDVFANMEDGLDDVTGAGEALNKVSMSDFDTALDGTKRRVEALVAELLSPAVQKATYYLNGFNAVLDGKGAEGFWQAVAIDSGEQDKNVAERQRLMAEYGLDESEAFFGADSRRECGRRAQIPGAGKPDGQDQERRLRLVWRRGHGGGRIRRRAESGDERRRQNGRGAGEYHAGRRRLRRDLHDGGHGADAAAGGGRGHAAGADGDGRRARGREGRLRCGRYDRPSDGGRHRGRRGRHVRGGRKRRAGRHRRREKRRGRDVQRGRGAWRRVSPGLSG